MTFITVQQTIGFSCCSSAPSAYLIITKNTLDTVFDPVSSTNSNLSCDASAVDLPRSKQRRYCRKQTPYRPDLRTYVASCLDAAEVDSADEGLGGVLSRSGLR